MNATSPSSPSGKQKPTTPTPPPTSPPPADPPSEPTDDGEQIEQLLQLNEQLRVELDAVQSQLSASLSAASTPLLRVGEGVRCRMLNARSLASMYVTEQKDKTNFDRGTGKWAAMADAHSLTDFLPEKEALAALARFVAQWEAILAPATPSRPK